MISPIDFSLSTGSCGIADGNQNICTTNHQSGSVERSTIQPENSSHRIETDNASDCLIKLDSHCTNAVQIESFESSDSSESSTSLSDDLFDPGNGINLSSSAWISRPSITSTNKQHLFFEKLPKRSSLSKTSSDLVVDPYNIYAPKFGDVWELLEEEGWSMMDCSEAFKKSASNYNIRGTKALVSPSGQLKWCHELSADLKENKDYFFEPKDVIPFLKVTGK